MAQVKFNRGQRSSIEALTGDGIFNQVSIGRDTTTDSWDSIYLGNLMVGTGLLRLIKPTAMPVPTFGDQTIWTATTPASGTSLVITADYNGTSPITTARTLVDYATATAEGGYTATDSEILTAKAVTALVSSVADNTYYDNFIRGTGQSLWTWTAAEQGTDQHGDLTITIPTESTITKDYNTASSGDPVYDYHPDKVPTSKAVTDFVETYFAGLAGGMRYEGSISSTTVPADRKAGDVFIASQAFTIGTAPDTISVEAGDMIVLNSTYSATAGQTGTLTTTNCDVFERNLDGAVIKESNLTKYGVVYATDDSVVNSTVKGGVGEILIGTLDAPKWLTLGTEGQTLMVKNTAQSGAPASLTAGWADTITYTVDSGSSANIIVVYRLKNGSVDTSYNETGWTSGVKTITINNVAHATNADAVLEVGQEANTNRNLLVGYGTATDEEYKTVEYNSVVTVNNAGQLTAQGIVVNEYTNGAYVSQTSINVSDSLTWHEIS